MQRSAGQTLSQPRTDSGVTLIELMIALFVFSIGALAVTAMCLMSIQGNSLANRMTQASLLAQDKMEELLSEGDVTLLVDGVENGLDGNGATGTGGRFDRVWTVTNDNPPDVNTRWLTVRVIWPDSQGRPHDVELKTLTRGR